MPLDKFGRPFYHNSRRIRILKVKGQLFYFVPLTIPCVKPEFKYSFPLESARIVDGGILAKNPVEVKMSINGFRIDTLNTLYNMV